MEGVAYPLGTEMAPPATAAAAAAWTAAAAPWPDITADIEVDMGASESATTGMAGEGYV